MTAFLRMLIKINLIYYSLVAFKVIFFYFL
jgi:hypothetical protein